MNDYWFVCVMRVSQVYYQVCVCDITNVKSWGKADLHIVHIKMKTDLFRLGSLKIQTNLETVLLCFAALVNE